jgi:hypothetical protein
MRVLLVLLALAAMPFAASVSQSGDSRGVRQADARGQSGDNQKCENDALSRNQADKPGTGEARTDAQCTPPPPTGASISGTVYNDITGRPALANWTVQLTGTVTATAVTDASGNYSFTGLPAGTYLVCEVAQSGWIETFPPVGATPCGTGGLGYSFSLNAGNTALLVNFGNVMLIQ